MYTIGNTITFNTVKGDLTGALIKIDAFPLLDIVKLNDGFIITAYELATGLELINSQSFTLDDFVSEVVTSFQAKPFNALSFFKRLKSDTDIKGYGMTNLLTVVNDSPSYNKWLQEELNRIENLPLLYSNDELSKSDAIIDEATKFNLKDFASMLTCEKVKKAEKGMVKSSIVFLAQQVEDLKAQQILDALAEKGVAYPTGVCHLPKKYILTWDGMDKYLNQGRKRFLTKHIPTELIKKFYKAYLLMGAINNQYGYYRFKLDYATILRIGIDNSKQRDITSKLAIYHTYLDCRIAEMQCINI